MKISLNWLKSYVDIKISPEKVAYLLNMAGLGVEKEMRVDGDPIFELEITPNRPDCLSYLGVAREVAAALNKSLKTPKISKLKIPAVKADVNILDQKGCTRYIGIVISGVNVTQSPQWIRDRLTALGMRSVNNVVDITNFCLLEQGQPLHAFDHDRLEGGKIIVRRAQAGEKIVTIDGIERQLNPSILVIADAKRPVAIAGIMGGKDTEVTSRTKNILLESAYFDPVLIRLAGRSLGLSSDSSYRFERGVHFDTVTTGSQRAAAFILDLAGGRITSYADKTAVNSKPVGKTPIVLTIKSIETSLGASVSLLQCKNILSKLGCKVAAQKGAMKIVPPSFRGDIKLPADIVEELARVIGYDRLPATIPQVKVSSIPVLEKRTFRRSLAGILLGLGFDEAVTYSLTSQKNLERTNIPLSGLVKVRNPLSQDQEILRPSLLPSFLPVLLANFNRGQKDLRLFETGKIYTSSGEKETLGLVLAGSRTGDWRRAEKEEANFYDIKGTVERLLQKSGTQASFAAIHHPFLEKDQGASILVDGQEIGCLGKVAAAVLGQWDIRAKSILFAQLDLEKLRESRRSQKRYEPVPEYPPVVRDVSLAIKSDVTFEQVRDIAWNLGSEVLASIKLIEEYRGDKIPAGHRGIAFSLVYQSSSHTLREEEVSQVHDAIGQALIDRLGAVRR